jgi:hypothetical protein
MVGGVEALPGCPVLSYLIACCLLEGNKSHLLNEYTQGIRFPQRGREILCKIGLHIHSLALRFEIGDSDSEESQAILDFTNCTIAKRPAVHRLALVCTYFYYSDEALRLLE